MPPLLEVDRVSKSFGGVAANVEISFDVREGEILGLIGPNGAGKTSLFNAISGEVEPDSGEVRLSGRRISGLRPEQCSLLGIARTFQVVRSFDSMTVLENVMVGAYARLYRTRAAMARAMETLAFTGLAGRADTLAHSLTPAEKRRLEVARALATEPRVLLLDEMLTGLTPVEALSGVQLIRDVRARGVTVMMVEHVMEVLLPLVDRAVVLDLGRVLTIGAPQEVVRNPAVIRAYLGDRYGVEGVGGTPSPTLPRAERGRGGGGLVGPLPLPPPARGGGGMGSMLRLENVSASYRGLRALQGVSLEVARGEIVAVVGANGAGKSTLLKSIAGLVATDGSIEFEGQSLRRVAAHRITRMGVSMVPEGRRLFPRLSVEDNLRLGAYARRGADRFKPLELVFSLFPRLRERLAQRAETLSGGEQQMLAIGRALMTQPRFLMLDEPSQGIMPRLVDDILAAVGRIRDLGVTVLLVEQRLVEALAIADRAYVLQTGRIVMAGPAAAILADGAVRKAYLGM